MKVLHSCYSYRPDPPGGTEIYVEALVNGLKDRGIESVIAAPGIRDESYECHGISVHRMKSPETDVLTAMYGGGDNAVAQRLGRILDAEQPDVVHLHMFNREISRAAVEEARRRGCAVVFTYHTPTASCARGTLLRWGSEVCDGALASNPCAACLAHTLGVNKTASQLIGNVPPAVGRALGRTGVRGSFWTAMRLTDLIANREHAFESFIGEVDHLVAVCGWVRDLLLRNGADPGKISFCRQGLCCPTPAESTKPAPDGGPLRIAFFGRLQREKGPHVIMDAIRSQPTLDVRCDFYGVIQGEDRDGYLQSLRERAAKDERLQFREPVSSQEVASVMREYDLVAVPSLWLETGPLVILEAFAARVPVLASDLGGPRELVRHNHDGLLIAPGATELWADAIRRIYDDRSLLDRLRAAIQRPRTMARVAEEMAALYSDILSRRSAQAASASPEWSPARVNV